jgi:isoquinoline 1-oxidoreductase subunit alpha
MAAINLNCINRTIDVESKLTCCRFCAITLICHAPGMGAALRNACTIQLDGVAVRLCSISVSTLGDKAITTIEGISENGDHPVQQA